MTCGIEFTADNGVLCCGADVAWGVDGGGLISFLGVV